jgi:hypothetical protein
MPVPSKEFFRFFVQGYSFGVLSLSEQYRSQNSIAPLYFFNPFGAGMRWQKGMNSSVINRFQLTGWCYALESAKKEETLEQIIFFSTDS